MPYAHSSWRCPVPAHTGNAWLAPREGGRALAERPTLLVPSSPLCWAQGVDREASLILAIFEVTQILNVTKLSFFFQLTVLLWTRQYREICRREWRWGLVHIWSCCLSVAFRSTEPELHIRGRCWIREFCFTKETNSILASLRHREALNSSPPAT